MRRLFRQFSFPGGIPSHVAPETPGSIHEGGELGYALSHAYGAAFDNPDLVVCAVVGDGEAETGPLATSWHSNKFLNPVDGRRRPADPPPQRLQDRQPDRARPDPAGGAGGADGGLRPQAVLRRGRRPGRRPPAAGRDDGRGDRGDRPDPEGGARGRRHRAPALADDRAPDARRAGPGPKTIDGKPGRGDLALAPGADERGPQERGRTAPSSRSWMRSYRPEELFDDRGALVPELAALPPKAHRRMSANPVANGGELLRDLVLPDFRDYAVDVPRPGATTVGGDPGAGHVPPRRHGPQPRDLPDVRPGRDRLQPPGRGPRRDRSDLDGRDHPGRRPPRPGRPRDGGALRAPVPGLAGGLPAHRPPRPVQLLRSLHPHHRLDVQPAREVAEGHPGDALAAPDRVAQLRAELARLAPGPQRLLAPGPGLHRPRREQEVGRHPRLPAAGRQHPALRGRPLPAQPPLRQRDRRRQAAQPQLAVDGPGDPPLHTGHRDLGLGQQRPGRRARRRHRLCRRRPHARGAGRRRPDPRSTCPTSGSGSSTSWT